MHFQAGQYVNLVLPDGIGSRAFSIANAPEEGGEIELNIRIVPGGSGTTYVHEQLKAGDRLTISGPYGRFFVKKSADLPVLFMAGGSGLSSPRAMIHDLLTEGFAKPITLVYGQRHRAELYYHDEFLALAEAPQLPLPAGALPRARRQRLAGLSRLRPRGGEGVLRQRLPRPQGLPVRPAADDRRLHHHADAGTAVRARHLHREVPLGGRCAAGQEPVVQGDLMAITGPGNPCACRDYRRTTLPPR